MSFGKLDSKIISSSLMEEDIVTRYVFMMLIAIKDDTGFVTGTRKSLARIFNVPLNDFDSSMKILSSPDPDSRTEDFEGRRVEKIEGGYVVLNHEKYKLRENVKKEKHRDYMRDWREKRKKKNITVNDCEFTETHSGSPSISISKSLSKSNNTSTNLDTSNTEKKVTKSKIEEIYKEYPRKVGKGAALKSIEKALKKVDHEKLIDLVKKYSASVKNLDVQFIPHPATWFNQERWDDPIEERKPPSKKRQKNEYQDDRSHELPIYSIGDDGECKLTYGVGSE